MKQSLFCLLSLAGMPLLAGERVQMEMTDLNTKKVVHEELLLDATRMRMNVDANVSVMFLTDGGRNRMVMLDKAKNEYTEIDQQTMNQMAQTANAAMAQLNNLPPEQRAMVEQMMRGRMGAAMGAARVPTVYTAKGNSTVNGFACTQYEGTRQGQKVSEICAAQPAQLKVAAGDFQIFEKMREFTSSMMSAMANSPFASQMPPIAEAGFQGFPVMTTGFTNGQPAHRSEIKSIAPATLSDADFSTGNAKKADLPMPTQGSGRRGR